MTCFPQKPAFGPRLPGSKDGKQTVLGTQHQGYSAVISVKNLRGNNPVL